MGFTPNVIDGNPIQSAWGNEIRDRTLQVFATVAERDAQWLAPPNGAQALTLDTGSRWERAAGAWVAAYGRDQQLAVVAARGLASQQSMSSGAGLVNFNSVPAGWGPGTTTTLTVPAGAAGMWSALASCLWSPPLNAATRVIATLNLGGVEQDHVTSPVVNSSVTETRLQLLVLPLVLAVGNTLTLSLNHNHSANVPCSAWLFLTRLGHT